MYSALQRLQPGLLVAISSMLACSLGDFSLEGRPCPCAAGFVCDEASQTCRTESSGEGGATSTSTSGGGDGGGGGVGGAGAGGGVIADAVPLELVRGSTDATELRVAGSFALDFDAAHSWQIARWYDGLDADTSRGTNLAGNPPYLGAGPQAARLSEPMQFQPQGFSGNPKGWLGSADMSVTNLERFDETPVRYRMNLTLDYQGQYRVEQRTTVHASGRIDVESTLTKTSGPPVTLDWAEAQYTSMPSGWTWSALDQTNFVARFTQPASEASLLVIARPPQGIWAGLDAPYNAYMNLSSSPIVLEPSLPLVSRGALALRSFGDTPQEASAYAQDLLSPSIVVEQGSPIGDGFDELTGTYQLGAESTGARFRLGGDQARFAPTIEVLDFPSDAWDLYLDGVLVARSDDAVAGKVIGDRTLVRQLDESVGQPQLLIHHSGVLGQQSGGHLFSLEAR